ncbi:MAG: shikimate dehydrogenase [Solirubrobacterales bacterium]
MAAEAPRFGVAGYPVAHSRSPRMHSAAYVELGIDATYQLLPIPPELFAETVRALPGSGYRGINVTIPHKHAAAELADARSAAVEAIGAANTLTFSGGEIRADNTDAPGLIAALGGALADRSALVLGAGGTARAAVWALKDSGAEVSIHNRTAERAAKLADEFGADLVFDVDGGAGFDLIVNTTAVGMDADFDEDRVLTALGLDLAAIEPAATIVDFVYRDGGSPLTAAARAHGLRVVDGAELLARQGALSFELWFDRPAPLATMQAVIAE